MPVTTTIRTKEILERTDYKNPDENNTENKEKESVHFDTFEVFMMLFICFLYSILHKCYKFKSEKGDERHRFRGGLVEGSPNHHKG